MATQLIRKLQIYLNLLVRKICEPITQVVVKEQLQKCTFTNSSLDIFRQGRFCQPRCWDCLKNYECFPASKKIRRMGNPLIGKHSQLKVLVADPKSYREKSWDWILIPPDCKAEHFLIWNVKWLSVRDNQRWLNFL